MTDLEVGSLVVIIVALCEGLKFAGIKSRFIPLIAAILGIVGAFVFAGRVGFLVAGAGVLIGLATTGGYRLVKTSILNK